MATRTSGKAKRADNGTVEVTLAHHWTDRRDPDKEVKHKAGAKIRVSAADARALVSAGYIAADPEDPDSVREALGSAAPPEPAAKP